MDLALLSGATCLWLHVTHSEDLDYTVKEMTAARSRLVCKWKQSFRLAQCVDTMINDKVARWLIIVQCVLQPYSHPKGLAMCHCSQPLKTWKTMQAGHHKAIIQHHPCALQSNW